MSDATSRPTTSPNDILRLFVQLATVAIAAIWGAFSWPFPWNIAVAITAVALIVLIWALFLSPRSVVHTDSFVQTIIELVLVTGAATALWTLGAPIPAIIFEVVAVISIFLSGWTRLAR